MRKTYQCLNDTALKHITTQYIHFAEYCHTKQYLEQQKREKNLIIFLSFKKILFYQITISYMVILHSRYAFGIRDL